jgi:histidinol-phosphate/aromatic aminotransferase/cobyric acid decarboxylase-like protein
VEDEAIRPPEELVAALKGIPTRLYGYTYLRDLREPKERTATLFHTGVRLDGESLTAQHVAILPNSTQALLLTLAALRDSGVEQIVVAAPVYFSAVEVCRRLGLVVSVVPAADFVTGALDLDALAQAVERPRSALLLTNPAYSIGVEYEWSTLRTLFAALPSDRPVILDETRMGLSWRREAPWYDAVFPPQAIVIRSPSKVFFVSGSKTSLLFATPAFVRRVETASESLLGSVPGALEETALAYLRCWRRWRNEARRGQTGPLLRWQRDVIARLQVNLELARPALQRHGFVVSPVNSGPYALAARRAYGQSDLDCVRLAGERGVLAMSAPYFNHERVGWQGLRLNLGVPAPMAFFSFGGWKNSFFGDLHTHGKDAVAFYTEQKVIMSRWF